MEIRKRNQLCKTSFRCILCGAVVYTLALSCFVCHCISSAAIIYLRLQETSGRFLARDCDPRNNSNNFHTMTSTNEKMFSSQSGRTLIWVNWSFNPQKPRGLKDEQSENSTLKWNRVIFTYFCFAALLWARRQKQRTTRRKPYQMNLYVSIDDWGFMYGIFMVLLLTKE